MGARPHVAGLSLVGGLPRRALEAVEVRSLIPKVPEGLEAGFRGSRNPLEGSLALSSQGLFVLLRLVRPRLLRLGNFRNWLGPFVFGRVAVVLRRPFEVSVARGNVQG